jgi:hypothetical protein
MDTVYPDKKEHVKAKQLEALKRLGHNDLQLDEYERMCISFLMYAGATLYCSVIQGLWPMKSFTQMTLMCDFRVHMSYFTLNPPLIIPL